MIPAFSFVLYRLNILSWLLHPLRGDKGLSGAALSFANVAVLPIYEARGEYYEEQNIIILGDTWSLEK